MRSDWPLFITPLTLTKSFCILSTGTPFLISFSLGFIYENGKGIAQDYVKAARFYRMAAEQGHAIAQYHLGSTLNLSYVSPLSDLS